MFLMKPILIKHISNTKRLHNWQKLAFERQMNQGAYSFKLLVVFLSVLHQNDKEWGRLFWLNSHLSIINVYGSVELNFTITTFFSISKLSNYTNSIKARAPVSSFRINHHCQLHSTHFTIIARNFKIHHQENKNSDSKPPAAVSFKNIVKVTVYSGQYPQSGFTWRDPIDSTKSGRGTFVCGLILWNNI